MCVRRARAREREEAGKRERERKVENKKENKDIGVDTSGSFAEIIVHYLQWITYTHAHTLAATHCNTLQHTSTHCNTLQHTATHAISFCGDTVPARG